MARVMTLFGTRPEVIKLAPVIRELESRPGRFQTINVTSAQHTDLLYPFAEYFGIRLDCDLRAMEQGQDLAHLCSRVLIAMDEVLIRERPDLLLVQGDTTTAVAGAMAGFYGGVPVGHVEAGLRSGNRVSPFPEEMNRRLITRLARYHFAATPHNVETLLAEGAPAASIALTGNPVVDALQWVLGSPSGNGWASDFLEEVGGSKLVVLTTHRRESFGEGMAGNLRVLRDFVEQRPDVALAFPVHPNPAVQKVSREILEGAPRIHLLEPLEYPDFIRVLSAAWLIVSDSGGVQEEAPTLGKPLLILRENTERPEAVECGAARIVGRDPSALRCALEELYPDHPWLEIPRQIENPFGRGDAAVRIADAIERFLEIPSQVRKTGDEAPVER